MVISGTAVKKKHIGKNAKNPGLSPLPINNAIPEMIAQKMVGLYIWKFDLAFIAFFQVMKFVITEPKGSTSIHRLYRHAN